MSNDTRKHARGKWRSILSELGVDPKIYSGKHGPCPKCGGIDRFRFTDYKRNGEFFCNGCGPGDGFDIVMAVNGCKFAKAATMIDKVLGTLGQVEDDTFNLSVDMQKRRNDLNTVWAGAKNDEVVTEYLFSRGIEFSELVPEWGYDLRGHDSLYLKEIQDRVPGMVALIRNKAGDPISIHRTFIEPRAKKVMPPLENILGGGVHLGQPPNDTELVIGEGIETTLSGMMGTGCPGIATVTAMGMEALRVPSHIRKVLILCDNDASFTGQKAAFTLARELDNQRKYVTIAVPDEAGHDMNDDCGVVWFTNERGKR